jgi:outer membrane protein OmpU
MKHTLLATTALVAMTGAAAAELTISATGRVGLQTTEGLVGVSATTTYKPITAAQVNSVKKAAGWMATGAEIVATADATTAATAAQYVAALALIHEAETKIAVLQGVAANVDTAAEVTALNYELARLAEVKAAIAPTSAGKVTKTNDSTDSVNRMRVTFKGSGETDSGIAFGATIRADNAGAGASGTGGSQFVSGAFGKVSMGDLNGADESAAGGGVAGVGLTGLGDHNDLSYQSSDHNIAYEYTTSGVTFGYSQNTAVKTGSNSAMGIKWSGDMGGTTLSVGLGQSKVGTATQGSMSVSMSTGGLTLKAISSSNDNGSVKGVTEATATSTAGYIAGVTAANNADTDQTGVSISYAMDAMSITAFTKSVSTVGVKDKDYSGFGFTYDMGGVTLKAGVADNNDQQLVDFGLSFSF